MPSLASELSHWLVFAATVVVAMLLDYVVFSRTDEDSFGAATARSVFWILIGVGFGGYVHFWMPHPSGATQPAIDYIVAYLVEKSLSVDNLFVFLVVFKYFQIGRGQQRRVLFWGIAGALVMRGIFIAAGTAALHYFHPVMYVFGAFLVFSGVKLALRKDQDVHPEHNLVLRIARRYLRTTERQQGDSFFVKVRGKGYAQPLFMVLLVIEATDVVFAVDSVPAVLAISNDVFIVYTSNIMAILGLRALYFMLAGMLGRFRYLDRGLSAILVFIGVKMLVADFVEIPNLLSLAVISCVLVASVVASLLAEPRAQE